MDIFILHSKYTNYISCWNHTKERKNNLNCILEANHSLNCVLPLFFPTDSYPQSLSDLSQTSCACALIVWIVVMCFSDKSDKDLG